MTNSQRLYLRGTVRAFVQAFEGRNRNTRAEARVSAFLAVRLELAQGCNLTTAMFEVERYTARHA